MSLEVAEHLTRAAEPSFVHQLVSRATKGVLLSWAAPLGPAGWHHINCQSAVYVECAMAQVGLQLSANLTDHLRRAVALGPPPRCPWLKSTLLAFAPIAPSTPSPLLPLPPAPSAEWSARYLSVTQRRCPYVEDGCDWRRGNASALPPSLATGYCAVTSGGPGDCAAGGKGSWPLRSVRGHWLLENALADCVARCEGCARCRYVSVSARHADCSWFHECELEQLKQDVAGFKSLRVDGARKSARPPRP